MEQAKSGFGMWLPEDVSVHGAGVDELITILHYFMAVLFVGWGIFLVYCLIRFRQRAGRAASYELPRTKTPKWLEVGVAAFEAVLLLFFSMPVWAHVKNDVPSEQEALVVRVVAQQFAWNFHYPGADGVFGQTRADLFSEENPLGLDRQGDLRAADDIVAINNLHVPVNKPVRLQLSSKDVIHCLSIPALRVKQDIVPGMSIPTWFEARRTGEYEIACAQLCGLGHFRMKGRIFIEESAQFDKWLAAEAEWLAEEEYEYEFEDQEE